MGRALLGVMVVMEVEGPRGASSELCLDWEGGRTWREEQKSFCLVMPSWLGSLGTPHPGRQRTVCLFTAKVRVKLSIERGERGGRVSGSQESIWGLHRSVLGSSPKSLAWCLLDKWSVLQINTRGGIYEWEGEKKINFPHRLAVSQAEVFPRPPTAPPPRPLRFLVCRTCLFLEVPTLVPAHCLGWKSERKRTQGALWEADLHFLTDAGDWVSPSRLPPRAGGDAN